MFNWQEKDIDYENSRSQWQHLLLYPRALFSQLYEFILARLIYLTLKKNSHSHHNIHKKEKGTDRWGLEYNDLLQVVYPFFWASVKGSFLTALSGI